MQAPAGGKRMSAERSHGRRGAERSAARSRGNGNGNAGTRSKAAPGNARSDRGRKLGQVERIEKQSPEPRGGRGQAKAPVAPKAVPRDKLKPLK